MHTVTEPPEGLTLPPIEDLIDGPPNSWIGMPVEWQSVPTPEPVFLRTFDIPRAGHRRDTVFLFGARYSVADALVGGESFGEGYFVEYFVVEEAHDGSWIVHRLRQRGSVAYTESEESRDDPDYVQAEEITDPAAFALHTPPIWKRSEALWPTYAGTPMQFIGQIEIPDTELTRNLLSSGQTVYLFSAEAPDHSHYKIFEQDTHAQTAEEHYELEERLQRLDESASGNGA
jgi:hypothetical protein